MDGCWCCLVLQVAHYNCDPSDQNELHVTNYIVGKTAKYDQKSYFAHFQIWLEMGTEIYFFNIFDISHFMKSIV